MYYDITASWMIFRVCMHKLYFLQGLLGSLLFTHSLSPSYLHLCSFLSYCWIVLPSCGLMAVCFYDWGGGWRVLSLFITQSCPTLCHPMDCSTPGLPVLHHLLELAQTHVHWVGDAIQPSHPLLSPSPPALSLSQHQGIYQWVSSWYQVAKVLELQPQHQSLQWIFRIDFGMV